MDQEQLEVSFKQILSEIQQAAKLTDAPPTPDTSQDQISASFHIFRFQETGICAHWDMACSIMVEAGIDNLGPLLQIFALEAGVRRNHDDAGQRHSVLKLIKQEFRDLQFLSIAIWKNQGFSLETSAQFVALSLRTASLSSKASTLEKEFPKYISIVPLEELPVHECLDLDAWLAQEKVRIGESEFWQRVGERR